MRKNIVLVLLLFSYMFIYANDSIVTKGSESISINYDENNIFIQNEELNIYLFTDSYKVTIGPGLYPIISPLTPNSPSILANLFIFSLQLI